MKYLILKRAFKNFGDYLIFERAINILKKEMNNFEYELFDGSKSIPDAMVNKYDAFIIPGGPGITKKAYPKVYPLNKNIFKQNKPIYFIGGGSNVYFLNEKYILDKKTKDFLLYCNKFSPIGCRDVYTVNLLQENGITATMNGCPAWYDYDFFGKRIEDDYKIKKIMLSVPGKEMFFDQFIDLVGKFVEFQKFEIHISFNHGIEIEVFKKLYNKISSMNVISHDMSGGTSKSYIYDEMDLHVGYRVHTNIYFLSHRKPSILIAEDSRGKGLLDTFNGVGVIGYDYNSRFKYKLNNILKKILRNNKMKISSYRNINEYIKSEINLLVNGNYHKFNDIFEKMENYYENNMRLFVKNIDKRG